MRVSERGADPVTPEAPYEPVVPVPEPMPELVVPVVPVPVVPYVESRTACAILSATQEKAVTPDEDRTIRARSLS